MPLFHFSTSFFFSVNISKDQQLYDLEWFTTYSDLVFHFHFHWSIPNPLFHYLVKHVEEMVAFHPKLLWTLSSIYNVPLLFGMAPSSIPYQRTPKIALQSISEWKKILWWVNPRFAPFIYCLYRSVGRYVKIFINLCIFCQNVCFIVQHVHVNVKIYMFHVSNWIFHSEK